MKHPRLISAQIKGFRPFRDFNAEFEPLEVFVGANGAGKSSLFDFLRFLRDGSKEPIPPEIVKGSIGQQVFHKPGNDKFSWGIKIDFRKNISLQYSGILVGPVGKINAIEEVKADLISEVEVLLRSGRKKNFITKEINGRLEKYEINLDGPNLAISIAANQPDYGKLYGLSRYIQGWRFYSSFNIDISKIKRSIPVEQAPILHEDAGNLSSVLFNLLTEHPSEFDELQRHIKSVVPGFRGLRVKARGGPGEVIAFWEEEGVDYDLTLADLSDGIICLIYWITICLQPHPPFLICIDEPELGLHPRTLPLLAGLMKKLSERTQIFIATHDSYFLAQFPLENITVMRKENGEVIARKPKDSKALQANLEDFGTDELEAMHRNDELEALS